MARNYSDRSDSPDRRQREYGREYRGGAQRDYDERDFGGERAYGPRQRYSREFDRDLLDQGKVTRTAGVGDWIDRSAAVDYEEPYGFLYGEVAYGVDTDRDYGQSRGPLPSSRLGAAAR